RRSRRTARDPPALPRPKPPAPSCRQPSPLTQIHLARDQLAQIVTNTVHRLALQYILEESLDDHASRHLLWQPARHQVEELILIDPADRRTVSASHLIGLDLQVWAGERGGLVAQQDIPVRLVGVGPVCMLLHPDPA